MVSLVIMLTPPKKSSREANMKPEAFLMSSEAMSPLKRKANFSKLTEGTMKRFCLDPEAIEQDHTITDYHSRTQALLPGHRDQMHIHVPFEEVLNQFRDLKVSLKVASRQLIDTNVFFRPKLRL